MKRMKRRNLRGKDQAKQAVREQVRGCRNRRARSARRSRSYPGIHRSRGHSRPARDAVDLAGGGRAGPSIPPEPVITNHLADVEYDTPDRTGSVSESQLRSTASFAA